MLHAIYRLILIGLMVCVQTSFQQRFQSNLNVMAPGQLLYNRYPTTMPIFSSNALSYYTPRQRPESIYSQMYLPDSNYATASPAAREAYLRAISGQKSWQSSSPTRTINPPTTPARPTTPNRIGKQKLFLF